jgi:hypothetical protein
MSIEAMKQAVVYFEHMVRTLKLRDQSEPAQLLFKLRQAIEQAEKQEPVAWLTKELMADYLDMIAEAIADNKSETLRHKAHWMRVRGEI